GCPAFADHLHPNGGIGRVAMVGRPAGAPVVQTIERDGTLGAGALCGRHVHPARDSLELPVGIAGNLCTLGLRRAIEVRALGSERRAEKPAQGDALTGLHAPDPEGAAGARPAWDGAAI